MAYRRLVLIKIGVDVTGAIQRDLFALESKLRTFV
jgi:hypothetical protein